MNPEYEKRKEYYRQRYINNREAMLAATREYQRKNPHVLQKAAKRFYKKNAEKMKAKRRARYVITAQHEKEIHKKWVIKNREARLLYMAAWRKARAQHLKAYGAEYRKSHLDDRAAAENARRARKFSNGGSHTKKEWVALVAEYGGRCGYCGCVDGRLTKDHATPLSRGGTDDIQNIIPACGHCNRRKHAKTAEEFIRILAKAQEEA